MDDGSSPLWGILIFILFLVSNGIFYGFGAAIQKLSESDLERQKAEGNKKAEKLLALLQEPSHLVQVISIITTLLGICFGAFGIGAYTRYFQLYITKEFGVLITILSAVILLISLGVLSAKRICNHYPERAAYALVNFVSFFIFLFTPLTWIIDKISNLAVRLFGIDPGKASSDVTEEELLSMVDEAHEQGVIQESEVEMIQNIMDFSDKEAKDIMTHWTNIVALDGEMTLDDALNRMLEEGYSRYPVYQKDLDDILGMVHFKDVVRLITERPQEGNRTLSQIPGLVRQAAFIPGTRSLNAIFQAMQHKKVHVAIVVDEYGQTVGLVSMEDILEEIVGDIEDEYDEEELLIQPLYDNSLLLSGFTHLEDVEEELGASFKDERFETLNGYLTSVLGHIPTSEDKEVIAGGCRFQILSVAGNVIEKVRAEKLHTKGEDTACQDTQNSQI